MSALINYENGIYAIDSDYLRPQFAAIHLIVEKGRAALIDTGCNNSLPGVQAAISELGILPGNIDYVILTHIHLDHAGGAGAMMRAFPNARLVVHPRGARHMADPSKLIEGATAVYGAEAVLRLYGEVLSIDVQRITEANHGLVLNLAGRELLCLDTPGHAKHHIGIVDRKSGHVFSGDTFGVSYRELDTDGRQFVFPATTPIQFEPDAMHASIDLLMSYQPKALYLTHFGQVGDAAEKAREMHRLINAFVDVAQREKGDSTDRHVKILQGLENLLVEEASRFGCQLPPARILEIFANDLELNAQGLGVWLDSQS